ncbi:MAG TPA: Zn-ribbon domain-containing OB-fold protein [Gammaproteobacteria bacterium]|nr:Zn-ribbon domain-containing OB-fold protein [Gammaproteobacteria bacterium]
MHKPLPTPTPETRPFWDGCAAGELRYQRCRACGAAQRLPRAWCERCHAQDLEWLRASGRGTILSFTVVHRAPTAAWREEAPYVIALVDGAEGFRLMVNVAGGEQPGLAIGAAVTIGFVTRDGVTLPEARLA